MDSYMVLWKEFELLQEGNGQLQRELDIMREKIADCLELLRRGQVHAAKELLTEE